MPILHNNITINALVSLELDPATADSDFPTIVSSPCDRCIGKVAELFLQLYHKDQANEKVSVLCHTLTVLLLTPAFVFPGLLTRG